MIDYEKIKKFEAIKATRTAGASLHVTKTANGIRLRFNTGLAKKLGIDDEFIKQGKTLQILHDDNVVYIGEAILEDAPQYKVKGDENRQIIYSAEIGNALLKMSGKILEKNKTCCFYGITFDTSKEGKCVAVIDPKKFK